MSVTVVASADRGDMTAPEPSQQAEDRARGERQVRKTARYGKPRLLDKAAAAAVLRQLGLRDHVHPNDVAVFAYRDRAAADGWRNDAPADQPTLGITELNGEVVGVIDMRPQLAASLYGPVSPRLPDDWEKLGPKLGQRFRCVDGVNECAACGAQIVDGVMMHTGACYEAGRMGRP